MEETFKKLTKEVDDPFQHWYCYLIMPNEEIRLYETQETVTYFDENKDEWMTKKKYNWMAVDTVKDLGFSEMNSLLRTIKEKLADTEYKNRVNPEPYKTV